MIYWGAATMNSMMSVHTLCMSLLDVQSWRWQKLAHHLSSSKTLSGILTNRPFQFVGSVQMATSFACVQSPHAVNRTSGAKSLDEASQGQDAVRDAHWSALDLGARGYGEFMMSVSIVRDDLGSKLVEVPNPMWSRFVLHMWRFIASTVALE